MPAPDRRRWLSLSALFTALILITLANTVLNVAIPTMVKDLHSSLGAVQWVPAGYALVFASLLIIGGRLGDIFGARRVFMLGVVIFGIGSVIAAYATSVGQLVFGESVVMASGAALMLPTTTSIISNSFSGDERAGAFAAWGAVLGAGLAFGPVLGGYLTSYHSWRWAYWMNVPLVPLTLLAALAFIRPDQPPAQRPQVDAPGALLVGVGTFAFVLGISRGDDDGWASGKVLGLFLLSALAVVAFVTVERRKAAAGREVIFDLDQLRHLRFRYGLIATLFMNVAQMGVYFVMPLYLQQVAGLSPSDNGLWMLPIGISIFVFSQISGRLTRVIGTVAVVRLGIVANVIAMLLLSRVVHPGLTFPGLLVPFVAFGVGVGFAGSQLMNVVLHDVDEDKAGVASGANSTARQIGTATGVAVMATVLASSGVQVGASRAMLVSAVLVVLSGVATVFIPSDRRLRLLDDAPVVQPVGPA